MADNLRYYVCQLCTLQQLLGAATVIIALQGCARSQWVCTFISGEFVRITNLTWRASTNWQAQCFIQSCVDEIRWTRLYCCCFGGFALHFAFWRELCCFNGTAAQPTPLLSLSPHINCLLIVTDQLLYVKHYSKRARVTPKKRVSTNGQSKNVLFRWVVRGGGKTNTKLSSMVNHWRPQGVWWHCFLTTTPSLLSSTTKFRRNVRVPCIRQRSCGHPDVPPVSAWSYWANPAASFSGFSAKRHLLLSVARHLLIMSNCAHRMEYSQRHSVESKGSWSR